LIRLKKRKQRNQKSSPRRVKQPLGAGFPLPDSKEILKNRKILLTNGADCGILIEH